MSEDKAICRPVARTDGVGIQGWMIFCPACGNGHLFQTGRWIFNGNIESPTFSPSMLVHAWEHEPEIPGIKKQERCHSFVTDGKIQYLGDCTHGMAGQTVPLEPF